MKYILTLFLFVNLGFSQVNSFDVPNYKKIKRTINKSKTSLYYNHLLKKFNNINNKSMTLKEKRHLYYGYIFQKNYKPFGFNKYRDSLNLYSRKSLTKINLKKALMFSEYILSENPFDLKTLAYKVYLHKKNKDKIGLSITKNQIKIINDAILSSGNGRTKETAYYIIYRDHKEAFLKYRKLKPSGFYKTIDKYRIEYLNVAKNDQGVRDMFFNVSAFKINLKSKR